MAVVFLFALYEGCDDAVMIMSSLTSHEVHFFVIFIYLFAVQHNRLNLIIMTPTFYQNLI